VDNPRLVDIKRVDGPVTPSIKLQAFLGRYLFTEEYLNWVVGRYSRQRNKFLIVEPKDIDLSKNQDGYINKYISTINITDQRIHRAIHYGLKYYSFYQIHGNFGVFAFLSQMFTAFRDMPYSNLRLLL
jgi:hypothetical protein